MHSLPVFLRLGGRPVMLLGEGEAVVAKRRLLERAGARIVGAEGQATLAIVGPDVPIETVERLRSAGVLVNAVDRPDLCDFTLPAIVDRDPVLVAIGTGGVSAGLAAALRQRLEALLPAGLGHLAGALEGARDRLRAAFPDARARRQAIGALLAPGGALDPLTDQPDPAAALAAALPSHGAHPLETARFEQVVITSPDPDELTLRAARLLGQADRIHHPADMPTLILDRARADAERIAGPPPAAPLPGLTIMLDWSPA